MRNFLLLALFGAGLLTGYRAVGQTCFTPFLATGRAMVDGTCYQMTRQGAGFSVGNIWADRTIDLTQDFDFTFKVNQCGGADAVVFVLQNSGPRATISTEGIDGAGANLGYYLSKTGIYAQSLAVELDIYQNTAAPYNDPVEPHMMLALNGNPAPVQGPVVIPSLNDCADHQLRVSWAQATHRLTVQFDGITRLSHVQDLVANVFGGKPDVWFGFTSSTGGQTADQTICPVSITASPQNLSLTASGPTSICPGRSVQLSVAEYQSGYNFQWSPAAGLNATTGASITASPTSTTTYTVLGQALGRCDLKGTITVTVLGPLTLLVAPPRLSLDGSVALTVSGGGEGATYTWSPTLGLSAAEGATVTLTPPAVATTYTVTTTNAAGCTGEASVVVPPFVLPNIITPNGDNHNDTFRPLVSLEPVRLQVYSRWGQPVFEQANYQNDWRAEQLAAGSYYYRLSTAAGESWKGWVEVVR